MMYWDIIELTYIDGYKLKLNFKDGESSIVDLSAYSKRGGVFSRFPISTISGRYMQIVECCEQKFENNNVKLY